MLARYFGSWLPYALSTNASIFHFSTMQIPLWSSAIQLRTPTQDHTYAFHLSLPVLSFYILVTITALLGKYVLHKISRRILIFLSTLIPLTGHFIIYMNTNCETHTSSSQKILLAVGLCFFGMGLGAYYSISFPAVGLSVPENIRGSLGLS